MLAGDGDGHQAIQNEDDRNSNYGVRLLQVARQLESALV